MCNTSPSLCVSGDTLILTENGYQNIEEIAGTRIRIWNGTQFSLSVIKKTAERQPLYLVVMDDGSELKCTLYHTFYVSQPETPGYYCKKELKALKIGDEIIKCEYPIIEGDSDKNFFDAYHTGLLVTGNDLYDIPMNASISNKMAWLGGFIDGYGKLVFKDGLYEIRIDYIFKDIVNTYLVQSIFKYQFSITINESTKPCHFIANGSIHWYII